MKNKYKLKLISVFLGAIILLACETSFCIDVGSCSKEFPDICNWLGIGEKDLSGTDIISQLSRDKKLKERFTADAGVWEKFTIEEHTKMVFEVFQEQFDPYNNCFKFNVPCDVNLVKTFKMAIALHDIGKPDALKFGDKNRQHEFTIPILKEQFKKLGFSQKERRLAQALVGHDIMGDLIKGNITSEQAIERLQKFADKVKTDDETLGMPLKDFISLQALFFTIDAASYPTLRLNRFKQNGNLLIPTTDRFARLMRLAGHTNVAYGHD